jgi:dipeptidase D
LVSRTLRNIGILHHLNNRRILEGHISGRKSSTFMLSKSTNSSAEAVAGLEPANLWSLFGTLSSIPRPSFHEEKVVAWLKSFAEERGLEWSQDAQGNVVIRHPGTMSGKQAPPVIIQNHVDMVTEKNEDTVHDFSKDPIRLVRDGDWIKADGTTLGADNGIGACCCLAVLQTPQDSTDCLLPPIEGLFTIAEEVGLVGAFNLDGSMLKGKTLLNLDTEDWPDIFIGCAGGGDTIMTLDIGTTKLPAEYCCVEIKVTGLAGGHSGLDIALDRANAVKVASEIVEFVWERIPEAQLVEIHGGDKRNAIPRECSVMVAVPQSKQQDLASLVQKCQAEYLMEYGKKEAISISIVKQCDADEAMVDTDAKRLITLLLGLPHGVVKHSQALEDLVETSSNLASVKHTSINDNGSLQYTVQCTTRSSVGSALERVRRSIRRLGEYCQANIEQSAAYPGWLPTPDAEIIQLSRQAIQEVTGKDVELKAIHAGLECGILGQKIEGVQCVSFGPTIKGAHSPDEKVQISTVLPFYNATLKILERLAEKR